MQFVLISMSYQAEEEKVHCPRVPGFLLYLIPVGNAAGIDGVFSLPGCLSFPAIMIEKCRKCHSNTIESVLLCFDSFSISAHEFLHVHCKHRYLSLHFAHNIIYL